MDWIESLTGLSPDRGDGLTEAAIGLAVIVAALIGGAARRRFRRR
jgi:hypothetical protein